MREGHRLRAPGPGTRPLLWGVVPMAAVLAFGAVELALADDLAHPHVAAACLPFLVAPVAWRQRYPLGAAFATAVVFIGQTAAGVPANGQIAATLVVLVEAYAIGRHATAQRARLGLGLELAAGAVTELVHGAAAADYVFVTMFVVAAWLAGHALAHRAELADQLAHRAAFVEATADQRAQEAVEDERRRIARELHDLVAHAITVMVLQAAAAEAVLAADPARARDPLGTIQATGRGALADMKRLLGVLRETGTAAADAGEGPGLAPQPTLHDLGSLVEVIGAAGLPVVLTTDGDLTACPASVAASAFQIVREALTNALRHAGPATAEVRVRCDGGALDVAVTDTGRGPSGGDPGFGLVGMRERAAAFGGQLSAGARPDGGFEVHARFPFGEPAVR